MPPMIEFALVSRDMIFAFMAREFATGQFANGGNVPKYRGEEELRMLSGVESDGLAIRIPEGTDLGNQFARRSE